MTSTSWWLKQSLRPTFLSLKLFNLEFFLPGPKWKGFQPPFLQGQTCYLLVVEPIHLEKYGTVKLDHFPKERGEHKKIVELPPPSQLLSKLTWKYDISDSWKRRFLFWKFMFFFFKIAAVTFFGWGFSYLEWGEEKTLLCCDTSSKAVWNAPSRLIRWS